MGDLMSRLSAVVMAAVWLVAHATAAHAAHEYKKRGMITVGAETGYREDIVDENTFRVWTGGVSISSHVHMLSILVTRVAELSNERGHTHFIIKSVESEITCLPSLANRPSGSANVEGLGIAGPPDSFDNDAVVISVEKVLANLYPAVIEGEVTGLPPNEVGRANHNLCTGGFERQTLRPWHYYNILEGQEISLSSPIMFDETLTVNVLADQRIEMSAATTGFTQPSRLAQLAVLEAADMASADGFAYLGTNDLVARAACKTEGIHASLTVTFMAADTTGDFPDDFDVMSVEKINSIMRHVVRQNTPSDKSRRWMYLKNAESCGITRLTGGSVYPWDTYNILARRARPASN